MNKKVKLNSGEEKKKKIDDDEDEFEADEDLKDQDEEIEEDGMKNVSLILLGEQTSEHSSIDLKEYLKKRD